MCTELSLKEYEEIATNVLLKSYPNYYKYIMSDTDKFGEVVTGLIMADKNYNKDIGTIYGYRKQCIFWTIHHILQRERKHTKLSIDINYNDFVKVSDSIEDKHEYNYTDFDDELNFIKERVDKSDVLNSNQLQCVQLFLEYQNIETVSNKLGWEDKKTKLCLRNSLIKLGKHDEHIERFISRKKRRTSSNKRTRKNQNKSGVGAAQN